MGPHPMFYISQGQMASSASDAFGHPSSNVRPTKTLMAKMPSRCIGQSAIRFGEGHQRSLLPSCSTFAFLQEVRKHVHFAPECSAPLQLSIMSAVLIHSSILHPVAWLYENHNMSADPDLNEAIQRGGVQPGENVRDYLQAIHIGTSGNIAVFVQDLVNRLKTGISVAGTEYKLTI